MNYKKEVGEFKDALSLDKEQVKRIKGAIAKAYEQKWHADGPNIDQINAIVAPYIKTQEEAFFAATMIITDVFGAVALKNYDKTL